VDDSGTEHSQGRAVARNIFLDGNTFQNSRRVVKEPVVADLALTVFDSPAFLPPLPTPAMLISGLYIAIRQTNVYSPSEWVTPAPPEQQALKYSRLQECWDADLGARPVGSSRVLEFISVAIPMRVVRPIC
jgi:Uncharacterized protein conserved in bacteria (DUF2219)